MSVYDEQPWLALYDADLREHSEAAITALELFTSRALADPDFPLISYFDTTLTSGDIDRASDALAVELQRGGVGHGDRVALYLQNVPEFVVAMLATWKVGATVVPTNPMWRQRELELVLTDSGAVALVVLEELWRDVAGEVVPRTNVTTVVTCDPRHYLGDVTSVPRVLADVTSVPAAAVRPYASVIAEHLGNRPAPAVCTGDDIALLCYTSGTTGPPKGALISHGNVVFNAETFHNWRYLNSDDVLFAMAPLFHITGLIAHIAVSLLVPMRMVFGYRFDVPTSLQLIEQYRATFTVGAITAFIALLNDPDRTEGNLASLTKIISGGAPIPPRVVAEYEQATGVYIYNGYGLTEATSPTHQIPVGRRAPVDPISGALSIGIPVPHTQSRIVDDSGADVPIGEYGEIWIKGPQIVSGYWNKPDETANAIRDGWLCTGDIGFMDADGWFYLVDRKKDQINAAGYKVWPREVEDVLYEHAAVREAAVIGVPDDYRGETVKAVVSLKTGAQASADELIEFCRTRLAAYKYPRIVEFVDELPKNAAGKILRRELRSN